VIGGWILSRTDDAAVLFRFVPGSVKTIGRGQEADFFLDAPLVSRVHCRLTADKSDQLIVEDLDSTNGLRVNGVRTKRQVLKAGDVVTIGRVDLRVDQS
jgi:pSer/pThr/pTyr-binding forkhead associated (FHA) protein